MWKSELQSVLVFRSADRVASQQTLRRMFRTLKEALMTNHWHSVDSPIHTRYYTSNLPTFHSENIYMNMNLHVFYHRRKYTMLHIEGFIDYTVGSLDHDDKEKQSKLSSFRKKIPEFSTETPSSEEKALLVEKFIASARRRISQIQEKHEDPNEKK